MTWEYCVNFYSKIVLDSHSIHDRMALLTQRNTEMDDYELGETGWCRDFTLAPPNVRVIVCTNMQVDRWATYDPTWSKGRGAWFDDKNRVLSVLKFQRNVEAYLRWRAAIRAYPIV